MPPPSLGGKPKAAETEASESGPAQSEAAGEAHAEEPAFHEGPRPIEYFYGNQLGNISQVNFWIALTIGVFVTGFWYAIMWLALPKDNYLRILFVERSWVQYVETFLAAWTLGILILKVIHIRKQADALKVDALPDTISPEINIYNIADFYEHVIHLPRKIHNSFMFKRIRKGLEYFYVRENNAEVAGMMSTQSDIDANAIAGSYALPKVFLWAIPIMGFIGTVLGIGQAIGRFAIALQTAGDEEAMMGGLKDVLAGLGTAFDTTFLALVLSILLMIPAASLQAKEEDVLNQVDEYCNDALVKRLNAGDAAAQTDPAVLKALGETITASNQSVVSRFSEIHGNMRDVYDQQTKHYRTVAEAVDRQLAAIEQRAKGFEKSMDSDMTRSLYKLSEGITNLNTVLKELDGKQIIVKKKLFGIF